MKNILGKISSLLLPLLVFVAFAFSPVVAYEVSNPDDINCANPTSDIMEEYCDTYTIESTVWSRLYCYDRWGEYDKPVDCLAAAGDIYDAWEFGVEVEDLEEIDNTEQVEINNPSEINCSIAPSGSDLEFACNQCKHLTASYYSVEEHQKCVWDWIRCRYDDSQDCWDTADMEYHNAIGSQKYAVGDNDRERGPEPPSLTEGTLGGLIDTVLGYLFPIAGIICVIFIIQGGYMWIISAGDPDRIKQAQGTLTWAVIGLVFVMLIYALLSVLLRFVYNS